jgi:hypothetical protein
MAARERVESLIRRSTLIDGVTKRRWLAVLPYLTPTDRDRLARLLAAGGAPLDLPDLDWR